MPYTANGVWIAWPNATSAITNSSDPFSASVGSVNQGLPILFPILLGSLYVFLWLMFRQSPSRFKLVCMTLLVFVISVFMAAGGYIGSALLNFVVFVIAYFVEFLFKAR